MERKKTIEVLIGISNLFMIYVGVALISPVMPEMLEQLNVKEGIYGWLLATYALAQFLTSPFTGKISDIIGRKKMIVIGMVLFSISELVFGMSTHLVGLFIARILGGVGAAFVTPAVISYVADVTNEEQRGKAMGWIAASISGGFIIGPGIGGVLGSIDLRLPFWAAAAVGLAGALFATFKLQEPKRHHELSKENIKISTLLFARKYREVFLVIALSSLALAGFEALWPFFLEKVLHQDIMGIAKVNTSAAVAGMFIQVLIFDRLLKLIGAKRILFYSFLMGALSIFVILVSTIGDEQKTSITLLTLIIATIASALLFTAFDLIRAAFTTYLSQNTDENNQGAIGGINSSLTSIGTIVGPVIIAAIFERDHMLAYIIIGILLLLGVLICGEWIRHSAKKRKEANS